MNDFGKLIAVFFFLCIICFHYLQRTINMQLTKYAIATMWLCSLFNFFVFFFYCFKNCSINFFFITVPHNNQILGASSFIQFLFDCFKNMRALYIALKILQLRIPFRFNFTSVKLFFAKPTMFGSSYKKWTRTVVRVFLVYLRHTFFFQFNFYRFENSGFKTDSFWFDSCVPAVSQASINVNAQTLKRSRYISRYSKFINTCAYYIYIIYRQRNREKKGCPYKKKKKPLTEP